MMELSLALWMRWWLPVFDWGRRRPFVSAAGRHLPRRPRGRAPPLERAHTRKDVPVRAASLRAHSRRRCAPQRPPAESAVVPWPEPGTWGHSRQAWSSFSFRFRSILYSRANQLAPHTERGCGGTKLMSGGVTNARPLEHV